MSRRDLLASIAHTIEDYRTGEIPSPTTQHVDRWIGQFDAKVQEPMLAELDHVLKKTYIPKRDVESFLDGLVSKNKLAGDDPCTFWRGVKLLDVQTKGNSQRELLQLFDKELRKGCNIGVADCGRGQPGTFVYLDDGMFTGITVLNDIGNWVQSAAPARTRLHIVVMALHTGGQYYASNKLVQIAKAAGKDVEITFWRLREIEDRRYCIDNSDVLRPTIMPDDQTTRDYAALLTHPPVFRKAGSVGANKFFSSEEGRNLLEQELLKVGAKIRTVCLNLKKYHRPLGNMVLETLGFGSLVVTFRNCPNNAPLALWVGDPWYPLFPRKIN